jgi:hypothetical protein
MRTDCWTGKSAGFSPLRIPDIGTGDPTPIGGIGPEPRRPPASREERSVVDCWRFEAGCQWREYFRTLKGKQYVGASVQCPDPLRDKHLNGGLDLLPSRWQTSRECREHAPPFLSQ